VWLIAIAGETQTTEKNLDNWASQERSQISWDSTLKIGTVPGNPGRMVTLPFHKRLTYIKLYMGKLTNTIMLTTTGWMSYRIAGTQKIHSKWRRTFHNWRGECKDSLDTYLYRYSPIDIILSCIVASERMAGHLIQAIPSGGARFSTAWRSYKRRGI